MKTILLIEDNKHNVAITKKILSKHFGEVDIDVAYDCFSAFPLLKNITYDIVITDLHLPRGEVLSNEFDQWMLKRERLEGYKILIYIIENGIHYDSIILITTAISFDLTSQFKNRSREIYLALKKSKNIGFITKPFRQEEFYELLKPHPRK